MSRQTSGMVPLTSELGMLISAATTQLMQIEFMTEWSLD